MPPPRVFLTAAELSADMHLANLARAVRKLRPDIELEGIGGAEMRAAGVRVHHETVSRARIGLGAFLRAGEMIRILRWTRGHFRNAGPPSLMLCCDSWTMNKHFLRVARQFGVPTLYYISPQVWASREGRVKRMRRDIDRMAVILPFEEDWLRQRGIDATFVGHPLFDELPAEPPRLKASERFPHRPPVVALIPGSRAKVARDNFPGLLRVARVIRQEFGETRFVVPAVDASLPIVRSAAEAECQQWLEDGTLRIEDCGFEPTVREADVAVCVSGTATLHTAALGVPLVAVFRAPKLGWALAGRWIVKTRTFALVNWLHPRRQQVVPEFIPWFGDERPVAAQVLAWLRDPSKLEAQRRAQDEVVDAVRKKGASANVARMVAEMVASSEKRVASNE